MRLDIVLLAAALFACVNTSSTSSISRTVRSITSKQEDVAAHEGGVETTKEERMSNFIESDNIASNYIEKIKHLFSLGSETNVMDAYKLLRLDKDNIIWLRNVRSKAWASYVKKRLSTLRSTKSTMNEKPRLYENEGILKLLDHLERFEDKKDLYVKLKSALMASWKDNKETPRYVFEQLKLDVKPPLHHFIDINCLELWYNYVFYNCKSPLEEITRVINGYDDKFRVMFLSRFRKILGAEYIVDRMEKTLLSSWVSNKLPVEKVYDTLDLKYSYDDARFNMWVTYVVKVCDTLQPSEEKAVANLSGRYSFTDSVTMFYALKKEQNIGLNIQIMLKSRLMKRWLSQEKTTHDVYRLLIDNETPKSIKLHEVGRNELLRQYGEELIATQL